MYFIFFILADQLPPLFKHFIIHNSIIIHNQSFCLSFLNIKHTHYRKRAYDIKGNRVSRHMALINKNLFEIITMGKGKQINVENSPISLNESQE